MTERTVTLIFMGYLCFICRAENMKCKLERNVLLANVDEPSFGRAIKKHVKENDYMDIMQCQCTDQSKVRKYPRTHNNTGCQIYFYPQYKISLSVKPIYVPF